MKQNARLYSVPIPQLLIPHKSYQNQSEGNFQNHFIRRKVKSQLGGKQIQVLLLICYQIEISVFERGISKAHIFI